jgi:hypothetical protein
MRRMLVALSIVFIAPALYPQAAEAAVVTVGRSAGQKTQPKKRTLSQDGLGVAATQNLKGDGRPSYYILPG